MNRFNTFFALGLVHLIGCGDKEDEATILDGDNDGVVEAEDCDDNDSSINPNASDDVGDGVDQNCDGIDGIDSDADGISSVESGGTDCDDTDADFTASSELTYYTDADGDGFGSDEGGMIESCERPDGFVENNDDCDDFSELANPDGEEVCDGLDNDCDGAIDDADDSVEDQTTSFLDADGDGYGDAATEMTTCDVPEGNSDNGDDCNDNDSTINPMAEEIAADGVDNNCDAIEWCYEDLDGDGFGTQNMLELIDDGSGILNCSSINGMSSNWDDCDDIDSFVNPDATEVCDGGIDNDCNSLADDEDSNTDLSTGTSYFMDADGDGYGSSEVMACEQGSLSTIDGDCDDSLATSNPMATDLAGDSVDQNCDGLDGTDMDGDGYASTTSGGLDCDDTDVNIHPMATEVCDGGIDNDCDGLIDDADDSIDISGTTVVYADMDGDMYGDSSLPFNSCGSAIGYVADDTDCDDTDANTYPGAAYLQSSTDCLVDMDGDGWSSTMSSGDTCYTIDMEDSYGDGWNGNAIEISEDGILMDTVTFSTGFSDSAEYCGTEGLSIDFDFSQGSYVSEVSYTISDPDGNTLVEVSQGTAGLTTNPVTSDTVFTSVGMGDCDDMDLNINPDASESCDGVDNNCDGAVDEGVTTTYYTDVDGDGYGDGSVESCSMPIGSSTIGGDCDDSAATSNPAGTEMCDGADNNCDGTIDEGVTTTYYMDSDGDGYGDAGNMVEACLLDSTLSANSDDCDDNSASAYPGSAEIDSSTECMEDMDNDGYGDSTSLVPVIAGSDCADNASTINPLSTDIVGDNIDQNCDGVDGTDFDGDGDPSTISGGYDCDDTDGTIENLDVDGDGSSTCNVDCDDNDAGTIGDDDGDGYYSCEDDCDDSNSDTYPNAIDTWYDGIDSNCDGANDFDQDGDGELIDGLDCNGDGNIEINCDLDGDGLADFSAGIDCDDINADVNSQDDDGDGFSSCNGDCWDSLVDDDTDGVLDSSMTYPGAAFNESATECLTDADGDGYAPEVDGCYVFETYDSYGDGWNGNGIDIYEDGVFLGTVTNQDEDGIVDNSNTGGEPATIEYCPSSGITDIELIYVDGQYNEEVGFDLYSPYGQLIGSGFGQGVDELVFDGVAYVDGDSIASMQLFGMDCDDADVNVFAGSDYDGDGYGACSDDCNDYDATINNGVLETWYDGIDQDCDGLSDYDQDYDGDDDIAYGGSDCDDMDASVEGVDLDGDSFSTCDADCDDGDATINPSIIETWYDGIDADCSIGSDYDQDGDGEDDINYGGLDCDDTDASSIGDDDGDGYFSCIDDCDDSDNFSYPGAPEVFNDGIDQDCDGMDYSIMSSCYAYYAYDSTLQDGSYDIEAPDGTIYAAYCDMTNGGWTLAVNAQGMDTNFGSDRSLWYTAGTNTEVTSLSITGKSLAYDTMAFTELRLTQNCCSTQVTADLSSDSASSLSLKDVVGAPPSPGYNNNNSVWNNGAKTFVSSSRTGSFVQNDYIKIWHGDSSADSYDYVVFSSNYNSHNDWSGIGNIGAVGGEFRMSGNSSDSNYYSVWIK